VSSERVLSVRELNRALLARQSLLERSREPLLGVVERMGAVQAQNAVSPYVALWSRLAAFRRPALTTELEARRAVQGTLMRSTIHLTSAADYWLLARGVRSARRQWWLRVQGLSDASAMERGAAIVRDLLRDGPRRRNELVGRLAGEGFPPTVWPGIGLWVDLVRVPPSGTWERRRADLFGLAETWLGPCTSGEAEGVPHLVRRYLGAFGPAPARDIANWAGLPVGSVGAALDALEVRTFRDGAGTLLFDLPDGALPDASSPAPVRFLPAWDACLLAHCRRTQVLPERFRPLVFHTKNPQSTPTILVDGAVSGTWRYQSGDITVNAFEAIPAAARDELEDERVRLAGFHTG
jgi:hypothetical protein